MPVAVRGHVCRLYFLNSYICPRLNDSDATTDFFFLYIHATVLNKIFLVR